MNYKLFQNYIQDKKSGGICGKNTDAFLSTEKWTEYLLSFHQNRKIKCLRGELIMKRTINEERLSDRIAKEAAFVLFTILLVLVLAMFISQTVMSQTEGNISMDEKHYQLLEQEYVDEIRSYLEEQGYYNSGVTLTRVVEANGSRSYEVVLHHKNIDKLSEEEQAELLQTVEDMAFQASGCDFRVNLLV